MPPKGWLVFIGLFVFGLGAGCTDKIDPGTTSPAAGPPLRAPLADARVMPHPFAYEAVGTITAETVSTLSGKLMGTVTAVAVREGDRVTRGQLLVSIDDRQVNARLNQAKAVLKESRRAEEAAVSARDAARAGAELARATYQRYRKLIAEDSASRQEFDEVRARHRQAEAALAQAEAMVEAVRQKIRQAEAALSEARIFRKDTRILAPFDGTVIAKRIEQGDLAAPGTPLLTIEKSGRFRIDVVVPENHIQAVFPEQKLSVRIPAIAGPPLEGIVKTLMPTADPQSRSFIIRVQLPAGIPIRSGMFARVRIPLGDDPMLMIAASAIVTQGQLTGVYVVGEDQIARFRLIRTGRRIDDLVEVISGLAAGSRYVAHPPADLKDGRRVEAAS